MKMLGRKTTKTEKTSAPKTSKATSKATAPTAAARKRTPTHEEIAVRSYELYLERGAEPGHADEDWLKAESELSS